MPSLSIRYFRNFSRPETRTAKKQKCSLDFWIMEKFAAILGSEQEFDKKPISRGFPKSHEFGLGDGHTLSLEE